LSRCALSLTTHAHQNNQHSVVSYRSPQQLPCLLGITRGCRRLQPASLRFFGSGERQAVLLADDHESCSSSPLNSVATPACVAFCAAAGSLNSLCIAARCVSLQKPVSTLGMTDVPALLSSRRRAVCSLPFQLEVLFEEVGHHLEGLARFREVDIVEEGVAKAIP
jgi:hypothetical protein